VGENLTPTAAPPLALADTAAVPESQRIVALDVLRGFALLGILVMNIQSFGMIEAVYINPALQGDLHGANYVAWLLSHVLAEEKFMGIFSMLFGAGIVLFTERQEAVRGRSAAVHYRRMAVLLGFGLVHAYFFWFGDILTTYALCGMIVYPLRKRRPWLLIVLGLLVVGVASVLSLAIYQSLDSWPAAQRQELNQQWRPDAAQIAREVDAYRGGWAAEFWQRAPTAFDFQTVIFGIWTCWRAGGLMLVGMALYRLGFFSARRSAATYATLVALAVVVGIPVILYGVQRMAESDWDPGYCLFVGGQYNYWASILVSLGWVGLVMLVYQSPRLRRWTGPLAAVGRTALSNYLLQTLIGTTLFYGHGLGLFGQVERVGQIGLVVAIWAFQLVVSPLWLRYFLFGPAEWLWRALTYGQMPPLRRRAEAA
jgi:uncharacterized protein